MPGLVDIAPLTETLEVRGVPLELSGLPPVALATLWSRFPELEKAIARGAGLDAKTLIKILPQAVVPLIAAGCGDLGNAEAERMVASRLSLDDQARALEIILRLTMPRGFLPFVQTLTALMGGVGAGAFATALASTSQKPSRN